ncbi:hypothetical protein ACIBG7_05760 [Nonomuraea sp. NPDC050328]|uniref:hypothetical protein n=1 Tax=Nonomuraea sp. NPDC050328 TaxID=3364361 RepID=UPI003790E0FE
MDFYIPGVSAENRDSFYDGIKRFAEEQLGKPVIEHKVGAIAYTHNGNPVIARVGTPDPMAPFEIVRAILELEDLYAVCTETRGVLSGYPNLVGKHTVQEVINFEDLEDYA